MTLEPISVALKFGFLAVLFLFLLWVSRSTLKDLRRGRETEAVPVPLHAGAYGPIAPPEEGTGIHNASDGLLPEFGAGHPRLVVERAIGHQPGSAYELSQPVTMGRGDVEIQLEDPFASGRHAHIQRQGNVIVIEDLGSTNGTYLNDEPLTGPQPLHPGDRIRIGDSEFSFIT